MTSSDPFRRLAKILVRAFYDDEVPPKDPTKKTDKADNRGNAIVILDALTRRQWMKEEELARQLHLHPKQVRKTLRALQEDRLVVRETRKENAKTMSRLRMAVALESGEAPVEEKEGEDRIKQREYSYCALDYGQLYDVIRYRILKAKKKIREELEDKDVIQEYACPNENCHKVYSALDVARLVDPVTMSLLCENCQSEVEAVSRSLQVGGGSSQEGAGGEGGSGGGGGEEDPRVRREKLRGMLERMELQLKPLTDQLQRVKDLQPPQYRSLSEWEAQAKPHQRAAAMGLDTPLAGSKWGNKTNASAVAMPFVGETKVEVNMGGMESDNGANGSSSGAQPKQQKVLPSWAIREGMELTAAQRGEVEPAEAEENKDEKPGGGVKAEDVSDEQQRLAEYYKAYYEALQARQSTEVSAVTADFPKSEPKLETGDEEEGVEWEDDPAEQQGDGSQGWTGGTAGGGGNEGIEWEGSIDIGKPTVKSESDMFVGTGITSKQEVFSDDDVEWDDG